MTDTPASASRTDSRPLTAGLLLVSPLPAIAMATALYGLFVGSPTAAAGAWMSALLGAAGAAGAVGSIVLWRATRAAESPAPEAIAVPPSEPAARAPVEPHRRSPIPGETDSMMASFSRMLTAIEQQASYIDRYAVRLDSAHREIETSSAQLKEFSFRDEVTGLYNRRFFSIRLEEEVSRYRRFNHPVSVVMLDLDGFKEINDELGHPAGDETLRGLAEILMRHSRGINVICRFGGDEFAVLLVETPKGGARLYADRIRYVLPSHRFSHGRRVTASFGIASLPEDVTPSPQALIQAADEALYAAKRAGKNRVSVHEDVPRAPGSPPPRARPTP